VKSEKNKRNSGRWTSAGCDRVEKCSGVPRREEQGEASRGDKNQDPRPAQKKALRRTGGVAEITDRGTVENVVGKRMLCRERATKTKRYAAILLFLDLFGTVSATTVPLFAVLLSDAASVTPVTLLSTSRSVAPARVATRSRFLSPQRYAAYPNAPPGERHTLDVHQN
jgi:hypothetical protein